MKSYETMLDELYEKLPKREGPTERFEAPFFESFIQGKQTIIANFAVVAEKLRRKPQHLLKFVSKEMASPATIDNKRLVLQGKFRKDLLNSRLKHYIEEYILCNECHRPDTKFITFEGHKYKQCEGCAGRSPVRPL